MNEPLVKKGWLRALIFLAVWIFIQAGILNLIYRLLLPQIKSAASEPALKLLLMAALGLIVNLPAVYIFRKAIDRKTFMSLGFEWKNHSRDAISGLLAATFVMATGTVILLFLKNIKFIDFQLDIEDFALYILIMTLIALSEEIIVRGYILNNLLDSFSRRTSLIISAAIFAALHLLNPDFSWLSMLGIFVGGILLGLNYIYTRNLWFGIFLHFAWNFLQGPVLGYKVSGIETDSILTPSITGPTWLTGGNFGFEASLLGTLLIIPVIVFLHYLYNRNYTANTAR